VPKNRCTYNEWRRTNTQFPSQKYHNFDDDNDFLIFDIAYMVEFQTIFYDQKYNAIRHKGLEMPMVKELHLTDRDVGFGGGFDGGYEKNDVDYETLQQVSV